MKPELARNQRRTFSNRRSIGSLAALVADLEDVAESLSGEKRGARAATLDQRIGRESRPMDEPRYVAWIRTRLVEDVLDPAKQRPLGRRVRGQQLARPSLAAALQHDIGEGAADIGGESRAIVLSKLSHAAPRETGASRLGEPDHGCEM